VTEDRYGSDFREQRRQAKKEFRAQRAQVAKARILQAGWSFCDSPMGGCWICLSPSGHVYHFWPSTGKWTRFEARVPDRRQDEWVGAGGGIPGRGLEAMISSGQTTL
jgi:hypothetical protein